MGFFTGTEDKFESRPRFTPEVQSALSQALQMGMGGLQQGQGGFEPIAQREIQRFQQDIMPSIAQRLTSMGSQSTGSGREEALYRGGTELSTNLAALGSQYDLQRQSQLMQLLGMGLTPREETFYSPGQQGLFGGLAGGIGQGLGLGAGGAFGGGGILGLLLRLLGGGDQQEQARPQRIGATPIASGSVIYEQPNIT